MNKIIPGAEPIKLSGNENGVLLIHGFTGSPYEMQPLAHFLHENFNCTVHVPLLAGHGISPQAMEKTGWKDWYGDAKNALFQLRKEVKKVVVGGLSMGGSLALHLGAHYEVDAILSLASGLFLKDRKAVLVPFLRKLIRFNRKSKGPDIFDKEERDKAVTYDRTPLKCVVQLLDFFEHFKEDLQDIYAPVFIAHSRQDHVVDFRSAHYIYQHVSSKNKRLLELNKSYHVITLDVEKEVLYKEIKHFLADIFR